MTSSTIGDIGKSLRPDFLGLRQYIWGTFPFSLKLPEGPNIHPLDTVNISAAGFMFTAYLYEVVILLLNPKQRTFHTQDRTIAPTGSHRLCQVFSYF